MHSQKEEATGSDRRAVALANREKQMPHLSSDPELRQVRGHFRLGWNWMKLARTSIRADTGERGQQREGAGDSSDPSPSGAGTEDLPPPAAQGRAGGGLELCRGKENPGGGWGWGGNATDPGGPEWASLGIISHQVEVKGGGGEMQDAKALFCKANVTD